MNESPILSLALQLSAGVHCDKCAVRYACEAYHRATAHAGRCWASAELALARRPTSAAWQSHGLPNRGEESRVRGETRRRCDREGEGAKRAGRRCAKGRERGGKEVGLLELRSTGSCPFV